MGANASRHFQWRGEKIKLKGKGARTEMRPIGGKPGYSSAIQFAAALEDSPEELQRVMRGLVQAVGGPHRGPSPVPAANPGCRKPPPSPKRRSDPATSGKFAPLPTAR